MLWFRNCGFLHLVPDTLGVWTDGVMVRLVCTFVNFGEVGALFSHCMSRVGILDLIASPSTPLSVSKSVSQSSLVSEIAIASIVELAILFMITCDISDSIMYFPHSL